MKMENLIIIGSGPAGLTAAIYAARADLNPLLIEGSQPGGQLTITTEVENYPGFPDGIMGPQLMEDMKKQAQRFGTRFISSNVESVSLTSRPFIIRTEEEALSARSLIIATGASARLLGIESETRLMGRGVSACATCDAFFFRNKEVLVVGGGDTAIEEALFLTKFASRVWIVHRRDELRASKIMQQKAFDNEKVDFHWNSTVDEILGDEKVTGVVLNDTKTGEKREVRCDGIFMGIGHKPNTDFLKGEIDTYETGYLRVTDNTRTSVAGVFAAGDVQDSRYRQAVSAAGSGCMAALDAEKFLENEKE